MNDSSIKIEEIEKKMSDLDFQVQEYQRLVN